MNEGTMSGFPKSSESALKKIGLFVCGTCIFGWTALGVAVIGVTLAKIFGYF
ncbi:MAG: hypothetical protein Q8O25_10950 [Sulfurisoma sp.]|nr:hypothetical protein [Sulfurisoma sp.]